MGCDLYFPYFMYESSLKIMTYMSGNSCIETFSYGTMLYSFSRLGGGRQ